ncbi:MAG: hypothetical protein ABFE13_23960 [Phycisphaerales bacterium]
MKGCLAVCCVFVMAVLVVSSAAFAEILTDGYWDPDTNGAYGYVSGCARFSVATSLSDGDDSLCHGYADAEYSVYTTEAEDELPYGVHCYGYVEAQLSPTLESGGWATAIAVTQVDTPEWQPFRGCNLRVDVDYGTLKTDLYAPDYYEDEYDFDAYEGIDGSHTALAFTSVDPGGGATAFAQADARAWGEMGE